MYKTISLFYVQKYKLAHWGLKTFQILRIDDLVSYPKDEKQRQKKTCYQGLCICRKAVILVPNILSTPAPKDIQH